MKFNRNNYEEFALDYLEGTMNASDREGFKAFLLINSDLQTEFEQMSLVTMQPDPLQVYERKSTLIKRNRFPLYVGLMMAALVAMIIFGVVLSRQPEAPLSESLAAPSASVQHPMNDVGQSTTARLQSPSTIDPSESEKDVGASAEAKVGEIKHSSAANEVESEATRQSEFSSRSLVLPTNAQTPLMLENSEEAPPAFRPSTALDLGKSKGQMEERQVRPEGRSAMPVDLLPLEPVRILEFERKLKIEVIHPALLRQFAPQEVDAASGRLRQWLSNVSLVPDAYRKNEGKSIKDKLLPEYMVAQ
ncbi:MAG: hypothetical protein KTR24_01070 [Saprospiraceae bacterium]|nr:hypothetical protein [Saprospiraceae bacterium]